MADFEDMTRVFCGGKGIIVLVTSLICTIASYVSISLAEGKIDTTNKGGPNIGHDDRTAMIGFLYCSLIALFGAMMIEQIYLLILLGPRIIPPSIRERSMFYLTLACNWISFAGGHGSLIIAMITAWHEGVPRTFTYAYVSVCPFLLSTMVLHVTANEIRWRLLDIAWIDGFSSIIQTEDIENCAICLETPTVGESVRSLQCEHKFHQMCVEEWLLRNPSCPLCRRSFLG